MNLEQLAREHCQPRKGAEHALDRARVCDVEIAMREKCESRPAKAGRYTPTDQAARASDDHPLQCQCSFSPVAVSNSLGSLSRIHVFTESGSVPLAIRSS